MSDQSASHWRFQLARRIAAAYSADPRVAAVEVGGSTARGTADRYSDVEIGVFWRAAPTVEARDAAYTRAGGTALERYPFDDDIADDAEEFLVAGVKVDVSHRSLVAMDTLLADVVERYAPGQRKQTVVDALLGCVPLHGSAQIAEWQARAAAYPEPLAVATVQSYLRFGPHAWLEMLAERGDALPLQAALITAQQHIAGILLAINRRYHPGYKWLHLRLPELSLAPPRLYERLVALPGLPPPTAVAALGTLIAETLALVEQELPEVDLSAVQARIARRRPIHAVSPLPPQGAPSA